MKLDINEVVVRSLGELLDKATPNEPDRASGRLRDNSVYRGMGDKDWRLLTSLDRLGGTEPPHTKAHLEEHLLRNFTRFARPFLRDSGGSLWELMCVGEHHGLPTRLLDWTHSPLVAAHFATLFRDPPGDRIIWRLNWQMLHERFGLRPVAFLVDDLGELLKGRGYKSGWELIGGRKSRRAPFACLLEPPVLNERLYAQSGAFTLATRKDQTLDQLLAEANLLEALTRFVIPAKSVEYLRDQLDLATVSERRLFPGLDGVASELKRYYSAKPNLKDPVTSQKRLSRKHALKNS